MRYLISGSSGLIGAALVSRLEADGGEVWRLVRNSPATGSRAVEWQPESGRIDCEELEGFDIVVHLGGENIAGRWTDAKKRSIRDSRVISTALLANSLAQLRRPPATFVCASAIGYYGERGEELLDEDGTPGTGFMADVCREWEAATTPAVTAGIRTLNLRFGVVLDPGGGALKKMLLPFRLGFGGPMGNGHQFWSWIGLPDCIGAIVHSIGNDQLRGPVNIVAPHPVRQREFASALGKVLHRPAFLPAPAFALRALLGEMADETLLGSVRVQPGKLLDSGYEFRFPEVEEALREGLKGDRD